MKNQYDSYPEVNKSIRKEEIRSLDLIGTCDSNSVAAEILQTAHSLVELSEIMSARVHTKLTPVMLDPMPEPECCETMKAREYPPLFNELRACFGMIHNRLNDIQSALDRTAL